MECLYETNAQHPVTLTSGTVLASLPGVTCHEDCVLHCLSMGALCLRAVYEEDSGVCTMFSCDNAGSFQVKQGGKKWEMK